MSNSDFMKGCNIGPRQGLGKYFHKPDRMGWTNCRKFCDLNHRRIISSSWQEKRKIDTYRLCMSALQCNWTNNFICSSRFVFWYRILKFRNGHWSIQSGFNFSYDQTIRKTSDHGKVSGAMNSDWRDSSTRVLLRSLPSIKIIPFTLGLL